MVSDLQFYSQASDSSDGEYAFFQGPGPGQKRALSRLKRQAWSCKSNIPSMSMSAIVVSSSIVVSLNESHASRYGLFVPLHLYLLPIHIQQMSSQHAFGVDIGF